MHHVVSATTNPAKIQAILKAFEEIFGEGSCHIEAIGVESGVPETAVWQRGNACWRTKSRGKCQSRGPKADFWVAIEAGIDEGATFSWVVIESREQRGEARSATLPLPEIILNKVREGEALGPVDVTVHRH